jgi:hypothetical protein
MRRQRWTAALSLTALAGLLAACETGTEPGDPSTFDAERALQDYEAMDSILASPSMDGFRALAQGVTFHSLGEDVSLAAGVAAEIGSLQGPSGSESFARNLANLVANADFGPSANPVISSFRRGKTFVYDGSLGRYVMDPAREGAPATGVRFILYEPGSGGRPNPEAEVGYADVIDEGDDSPEEIALRLMVVEDGTTILDYRTTVDILADGGTVAVQGYLQGKFDRLDFDISVTGTAGGDGAALDIAFEMGIAQRDFLITGSVQGTHANSGGTGEIHLLVQHGTDSFSVEVVGTGESMDGTIHLNGHLFATVEGDPASPTIKGSGGEELSWTEALVLHRVLDASEDVFDLFEDLLDPVDELVIIALIL